MKKQHGLFPAQASGAFHGSTHGNPRHAISDHDERRSVFDQVTREAPSTARTTLLHIVFGQLPAARSSRTAVPLSSVPSRVRRHCVIRLGRHASWRSFENLRLRNERKRFGGRHDLHPRGPSGNFTFSILYWPPKSNGSNTPPPAIRPNSPLLNDFEFVSFWTRVEQHELWYGDYRVAQVAGPSTEPRIGRVNGGRGGSPRVSISIACQDVLLVRSTSIAQRLACRGSMRTWASTS